MKGKSCYFTEVEKAVGKQSLGKRSISSGLGVLKSPLDVYVAVC